MNEEKSVYDEEVLCETVDTGKTYKACPFCGRPAIVKRHKGINWDGKMGKHVNIGALQGTWYVGCPEIDGDGDECEVAPCANWYAKLEHAEKAWETRALEPSNEKRKAVVMLRSENLTGLGGQMGTERTWTNWTKYFNKVDNAKNTAEADFGKKIKWKKEKCGWHSPDLRHVMYYIEVIKTED